SRRGQDWTKKLSTIVHALERLPARQAVIDGEVVVLEPDGTTSFQALQNALHDRRSSHLIYYAFDLLYLDGRDLTGLPLAERKKLLAKLVPHTDRGPLRFVEHLEG